MAQARPSPRKENQGTARARPAPRKKIRAWPGPGRPREKKSGHGPWPPATRPFLHALIFIWAKFQVVQKFGPKAGALRPTFKTLFYKAKSKVFGLRPARSRVRNSCFRGISTHFFCAKVCILSFWATFWSATEEGNASNAQNLALQYVMKGFQGSFTARQNANV